MSLVPKILMNLRLKRVSLVDDPANQMARVVLHKRVEEAPVSDVKDAPSEKAKKDDGDGDMDVACGKCGKGMRKDANYCAGCGDRSAKMAPPVPDPKEASLLKGLSPEVQALISKAQTDAAEASRVAAETIAKMKLTEDRLEKMEQEKVEKEFISKAKGLTHLSGKAEVIGRILKNLAKDHPEDEKELLTILQAANKAASPLYKQAGTRGAGDVNAPQTAADEIALKANEIVKSSGGKINYSTAQDQVIHDDPSLWRRHMAEASGKEPNVASGEGDE